MLAFVRKASNSPGSTHVICDVHPHGNLSEPGTHACVKFYEEEVEYFIQVVLSSLNFCGYRTNLYK